MDTNGILSVVENGLIHYRQLIKHRDDFFHKDAIHVTLQDVDLWEKFSAVTNEMIVTKSGRRMFPVVRCAIEGLQEHDMYSIDIEFVQIGSHRWKYMNGDWVAGGKAEPHPSHCVYTHPESPNFGSHWMKEAVSFSKVKLTNKPNPQEGQVVLNSLHKYEPRVHIVKVAHQNMQRKVLTYRFPETQFIAVTAYQNEEVTQLKIRFNPFAKAFQDVRERPQEMVSHQTKHYQLPTSGPFLSLDSNCHNIHHDFGSTTFKNGPTNASNEYCDRYSGIRSRRGCPYSSSHHGSIVKRSPSSYPATNAYSYDASSHGYYYGREWSPSMDPIAWTFPGEMHQSVSFPPVQQIPEESQVNREENENENEDTLHQSHNFDYN